MIERHAVDLVGLVQVGADSVARAGLEGLEERGNLLYARVHVHGGSAGKDAVIG